MTDTDPHDLKRFVDAQDRVYGNVLRELSAGHKQTHWMWFIFPQIDGLGRSPMAQTYAIRSLDEARAYLQHPVLGPRLVECTRLVNAIDSHSAHAVFGSPDDMKFRSSMTLFAEATVQSPIFSEALKRYFGGVKDEQTVRILKEPSNRA